MGVSFVPECEKGKKDLPDKPPGDRCHLKLSETSAAAAAGCAAAAHAGAAAEAAGCAAAHTGAATEATRSAAAETAGAGTEAGARTGMDMCAGSVKARAVYRRTAMEARSAEDAGNKP